MPLNPAAFSLPKINLPQQPRQQGENKHKYRAGKFWLEHPGKANAPTSVCSSFRAKPPFSLSGVLASLLCGPSEHPCGARLAAGGRCGARKP